MAHEHKLTVYTITLKPTAQCRENSNRWLFRCLINEANQNPLEDSFIFLETFKRFIQRLDQQAMFSDEDTRKCMTAHQPNIADPTIAPNVIAHSERCIIEGKVEGGAYGRKRNRTSTEDKSDSSAVGERDAITDDFYFMLYTPLGSDTSVLLLHSYSDDGIDAVMKRFWKGFFSCPTQFNQPAITRYVPNSIIEDFREGATVSDFTYTTQIPGETLLENTNTRTDRNFKITVKVEPVEGDLTIDEFDETNQALHETFFTRMMKLGQFGKKKASLRDPQTRKTTPFEIGPEFEIQPAIHLAKYVNLIGNGSDFERIAEYCFTLLESITEEIYVSNAVQER